MTFSYDASLDDLAEPVIRQFFRSQTAKKNRFTSSLWAGFTPALVIGIYFHEKPLPAEVLGCVVAAMIGFGVTCCVYPSTLRKRMRKYVEREYGSSVPLPTTYVLEENSLRCDTPGVSITFRMDDLQELHEDSASLELSFGTKGLCVIPLIALRNTDQKDALMNTIKNAHKAVHQPTTRVPPHA